MSKTQPGIAGRSEDGLLIFEGIDHIEFYVGNAHQAAYFYCAAFGFKSTAYLGPEVGVRDRVSFVIEQGKIRFVLTSAIDPHADISEQINIHGDGVKDIAFRVANAARAYDEAIRRGARPVLEPTVFHDRNRTLTKATIGVFGDTFHSFIERDNGHGFYFPHCRVVKNSLPARETGLTEIDHVAICVEKGKLDQWVEFYCRVLGFRQTHQEDVMTQYSGMNSKVVENSDGRIRFPIIEPNSGSRRSQVEEYLAAYRGPGAQHVALLSNDIVRTVEALRSNGIEFLRIPDTYYGTLENRVGKIDEDLSVLHRMEIMVDCDRQGYLMQIFTKPVQSRPTFFLEIIERKGARGFGGGNIKALFEAVEREQALRGNW